MLVALLDAYDLGMALRSRQSWRQNDGPKPTMVSIGWSRNWFHRWLQQPWIGNYDLLLTSSTISKTFFDEFGKKFGHAVQCVHGCPMERAPTLICTTPAVSSGTPNNNVQGSAQIDSGNRISDFKNLSLLRSGQVELSCTISIHKANSFGNNLLELTRFNYPYNLSDRYNVLMRPDPMLSQAIRFKPRYRQIARHRVQVPVKILRIGTNTETFVEKGMCRDITTIKSSPILFLMCSEVIMTIINYNFIHDTGHSVKDPIIVDKLAPSMDVFENASENSLLNTSKDMTGRRTTNAGVKFIESTISRLSSEREEVLNSADYAFTGSYYHVPRNIMTFDPLDLLPHFKGMR